VQKAFADSHDKLCPGFDTHGHGFRQLPPAAGDGGRMLNLRRLAGAVNDRGSDFDCRMSRSNPAGSDRDSGAAAHRGGREMVRLLKDVGLCAQAASACFHGCAE
jgi:hypothetical protein